MFKRCIHFSVFNWLEIPASQEMKVLIKLFGPTLPNKVTQNYQGDFTFNIKTLPSPTLPDKRVEQYLTLLVLVIR